MLDQNLINSVKTSLDRGETKEQIYQALLAQGHTVAEINDAIDAAKSTNEPAETQKRTVSIVVVIGAILIAAGIFSFIASNWQDFGNPFRLFVIFASMLLSYGIGWYIKEYKDYPRSGQALILLAVLIYGAGIFLVAQMYNIRANWPDGYLLWMLGVIVLAFAIDFFALLYFAFVLALFSLIGHPIVIFDSFIGYDPLLLTSTILLVVSAVACFFTAFYFRKKSPPEQNEIY